jgi:hypothetical protein
MGIMATTAIIPAAGDSHARLDNAVARRKVLR